MQWKNIIQLMHPPLCTKTSHPWRKKPAMCHWIEYSSYVWFMLHSQYSSIWIQKIMYSSVSVLSIEYFLSHISYNFVIRSLEISWLRQWISLKRNWAPLHRQELLFCKEINKAKFAPRPWLQFLTEICIARAKNYPAIYWDRFQGKRGKKGPTALGPITDVSPGSIFFRNPGIAVSLRCSPISATWWIVLRYQRGIVFFRAIFRWPCRLFSPFFSLDLWKARAQMYVYENTLTHMLV